MSNKCQNMHGPYAIYLLSGTVSLPLFSGCGMIKLTVRPINDVWEVLHKYTLQDPPFHLLNRVWFHFTYHQRIPNSLWALDHGPDLLSNPWRRLSNFFKKIQAGMPKLTPVSISLFVWGFNLAEFWVFELVSDFFMYTISIWFLLLLSIVWGGGSSKSDDLSQPLRLRYKAAKSTMDPLALSHN